MSHSEALKLLFPIELSGDHEKDLELEGKFLDAAQAEGETLLREMFPDLANDLLPGWERVCGLMPEGGDTLQLRRQKVIQKLRALGGLSRAYFLILAASLGLDITITELSPFMAGCNRVGDRLFVPEAIWQWKVNLTGQPGYFFRAGQSAAGERLGNINGSLEFLFQELKPAHTYLFFEYP